MKKNRFKSCSVILSILLSAFMVNCSSCDNKNKIKKRSFEDGSSYNGEWQGKMRTGNGLYSWKNGDRYEGDFLYGMKLGNGKYTWQDGSVYNGQWENDKINGMGKMVWSKGLVYEGEWKMGRALGHAVKVETNDNSK